MRLLALNIGNTNIQAGVFADDVLESTFSLPADAAEDFLARVPDIAAFDRVAAASVNPAALEALCSGAGIGDFVSVGPDCCAGLDLGAYENPAALGADRIAGMVAAADVFPDNDIVVVDAGTALTCDLVGADRRFYGGYIFAGPGLCLRALAAGTSALPELILGDKDDGPGFAPGLSTAACMLSAAALGFVGAAQSFIVSLRRLRPQARVILTGGAAALLDNLLPDAHHDRALILRGVFLCAREHLHRKQGI